MLNLLFSLTVNPVYHSKSKNWVITLHAPDVRDGSCRMCRLRRDVLVIPSSAEKKNAYCADFAMVPYARYTGQEAQFKQSRSKVSQMRWRGCRVGGNWAACKLVFGACLFYKQWEQISIGARLPSAIRGGCPLCLEALNKPLCSKLETHSHWHHFWSPLTMRWCRGQCTCTSLLGIIEHWMIVLMCGSQVLSHYGCWHMRPSPPLSLEVKTGNGCPPPASLNADLMNPAWRSLCVAHLLKTRSSFLPLFGGFLWDAVAVKSLWWLRLSSLGCSDGSLSTLKDLLRQAVVVVKRSHPKLLFHACTVDGYFKQDAITHYCKSQC